MTRNNDYETQFSHYFSGIQGRCLMSFPETNKEKKHWFIFLNIFIHFPVKLMKAQYTSRLQHTLAIKRLLKHFQFEETREKVTQKKIRLIICISSYTFIWYSLDTIARRYTDTWALIHIILISFLGFSTSKTSFSKNIL